MAELLGTGDDGGIKLVKEKETWYLVGGRTMSQMWNTDSKASLGWGAQLSFA